MNWVGKVRPGEYVLALAAEGVCVIERENADGYIESRVQAMSPADTTLDDREEDGSD